MLMHVTDEQRSQPGCTRRRIGRVPRLEAPKCQWWVSRDQSAEINASVLSHCRMDHSLDWSPLTP